MSEQSPPTALQQCIATALQQHRKLVVILEQSREAALERSRQAALNLEQKRKAVLELEQIRETALERSRQVALSVEQKRKEVLEVEQKLKAMEEKREQSWKKANEDETETSDSDGWDSDRPVFVVCFCDPCQRSNDSLIKYLQTTISKLEEEERLLETKKKQFEDRKNGLEAKKKQILEEWKAEESLHAILRNVSAVYTRRFEELDRTNNPDVPVAPVEGCPSSNTSTVEGSPSPME